MGDSDRKKGDDDQFVFLFSTDLTKIMLKNRGGAGLAKWVGHLFWHIVHGSNPVPKYVSKVNDDVNSQLAKSQKRDTAVKSSPRFNFNLT